MFSYESYGLKSFTGQKIIFYQDTKPLSFANVFHLLVNDVLFIDFFVQTLKEAPYKAFYWEVAPVNLTSVGEVFECVLIESKPLETFRQDRWAFSEHFDKKGAVSFPNLGGDAQLVVPNPINPKTSYTHLASFCRTAELEQIRDLWKLTGFEMLKALNGKNKWLSTCGLGIGWTHIRIDERPKYYTYRPYAEG